MEILLWIIFIIVGFLLGSLMFCQIIPKVFAHKNISEISDDKNPGFYNVLKHCGVKMGSVCLVLDVSKGFIPVLVASLIMDHTSPFYILVMIAPVLGHALGVFNGFHGGKCIAVSFGVMFGILPITWVGIAFLPTIYIFFATIYKFKQRTKCSVVTYTIFGLSSFVMCVVLGLYTIAIGCVAISTIIVIKHLKVKKVDYDLQING